MSIDGKNIRLFVICALGVNKYVFRVYTVMLFMKYAPDFPSLADEIAELRPDMNIKVAAFTVTKSSIIYTCFKE